MTPKKPDWFELTENGDSYAGIQKVNKVLPITTLVVAAGLILGGSLFANANNESSIPTQNSAVSQTVATSTPGATTAIVSGVSAASTSNKSTSIKSTSIKPTAVTSVSSINGLPMPVVTNVPQRGDDDDDDDDDERKGGDRERDHDDDDEDEDDD